MDYLKNHASLWVLKGKVFKVPNGDCSDYIWANIMRWFLWDDVSKSEVESKKNKENFWCPSIFRDFLLVLKRMLNCDKVLNTVIIRLLNEKEIIYLSYLAKMIRGNVSPLPISSNKMFGLLFAVQQ